MTLRSASHLVFAWELSHATPRHPPIDTFRVWETYQDAELRSAEEALKNLKAIHQSELQRLPRDALRVVADALQFQRHADGDVGKAQAARDGLLADEEFQAQPIQFLLQFINPPVAQDIPA